MLTDPGAFLFYLLVILLGFMHGGREPAGAGAELSRGFRNNRSISTEKRTIA